jgi:acylglycerol lipase
MRLRSFGCFIFVLVVSALLQSCVSAMAQSGVATVRDNNARLLDDYLLAGDGYRLPYTLLSPESGAKAIVIALHGFNDYSRAFEGMCQYLVAESISCLAYDQRGFGGTKGLGIWQSADAMRSDLKDYVTQVSQRYPQLPIFLVGESMGGAVIMSALAKDEEFFERRVAGTVLLAPAVWARSTQPWYQRWALWLAVHTFPSWSPTGAGLEIQATDNIEALRRMSRDEKVIKETRIDSIYGLTNLMDEALASSSLIRGPALVLYGELDEVIPKLPTCRMLASMDFRSQRVTFKTYSKGYHMLSRDLQAETLFSDMVAWMRGLELGFESSHRNWRALCSAVS